MMTHTAARRAIKFDAAMVRRQQRRRRALKLALHGFLLVTGLPIMMGYAWLFLNSFSEVLVFGLIPERLTLQNWSFLWKPPSPWYPSLWRCFANSMFLALGMVVAVVGTSTPAAYVLSRMKFPGRAAILAGTLILHAFPGITLLIALFFVLRFLGLLDSVVGVFLIRAALMMPFAIWVMKGFFDNIPWDVERAALVDGATRIQTWYKVMLPQVKQGIGAISVFAFLAGWAEYIFVLTFIRRMDNWTMASYVNALIGDWRFLDYGLLAAVSLFYLFPVLLFFLFAQRYLLHMTVGGMKGGG